MIDIVIVNWNSSNLLRECVESIFQAQNALLLGKVFIIDNNSEDDSLENLVSHEKVEIIRNAENLGFAKAANQGFRASSSGYVLLLNPDTRLFAETLPDSLSFMDEHPDIDVMGCQLHNEAGKVSPTCSRFPTPAGFFAEAVGLTKAAPRLFKPAIIMAEWDHKTSRYVDQVMGAYMFIRQSVFQRIGYLDEDYFVYFEDLDFSKRLADAGGKTFYNTSVHAVHIGAGTTTQVKALRLAYLLESRLIYSRKHFSLPGRFLVSVVTYFIEPVTRSAFFWLSGNRSEAKEALRGFRMFRNRRKTKNRKTT